MSSDDRNLTNTQRAIRTAWLIVLLLWPVALLNYLDRQMLASMKTSVMLDIPSIANDANWGYMLGQFKWVYALLSPVGGYIADRFSRRLVICASLFFWSAITWATGQVTTYDGLLWTRTLMGVSEAFYMPAALALIADHHLRGSRSRAVGLHHTGMYVGIILGGFTGHAAENPELGWRWVFDITGLAGIVYAFPLLLLLRDAPADRRDLEQEPTGKVSVPRALWELLSNGSFILLVLYFTLPAIAGWVVRDWMPSILQDRFNISQGTAGVSASTYVNIAAFFGVFLGGYLADRWMRSSNRGRIYVSALGMALIVPSLFGIGNSASLAIAILFLALYGIGWGFFDGNNMPILSQIVRPELRATGYGLMNMASIGCGGFADWGFGLLRDAKVPLNIIFGTFASVAAFSALLVLFIRPKDTKVVDDPH